MQTLIDQSSIRLNIKKDTVPGNYTEAIQDKMAALDIELNWLIADANEVSDNLCISCAQLSSIKNVTIEDYIEHIIIQIPFDFDALRLLVEGESKIIKLLNDKIVIEKFKPTIYSYTHNRYGVVDTTDNLRVKFTSEVFRQMNRYAKISGKNLKNAFLGCIEDETGIYLVQERMVTSNLEIRVKRYHVGSPVHRYRFTESYDTLQKDKKPLFNWTRFDKPIVCFDWRHPLTDEHGARLADEPISDDYASIWMKNIPQAKQLASDTFIWLESLFAKANLVLVDICYFINKDGNCFFGEISPDCMRVRQSIDEDAQSYDKDIWRKGGSKKDIATQYELLYDLIFNQ
ncbi:phosphoribosylaminoimidazolesuccinocarboxamide synthase [Aquimarina celericrescens]|uniref:Phosphoribosylaminoimidazolesuccinocarboxamide synthase n=1 Tax=Aquimarina celericrescens TaxID=1964542 RepID=A0ABW5AZJ2_9FLAO|nr:hypothetical protein [Aquimarina celericrescens]